MKFDKTKNLKEIDLQMEDILIAVRNATCDFRVFGNYVSNLARSHKSLEERAGAYGGKLNLDREVDWGEPVGREVW